MSHFTTLATATYCLSACLSVCLPVCLPACHNNNRMVKYAGFASLAPRMESFHTLEWCKSRSLAETLAVHGFFYVGSRDAARCFECGVTLHTWLDGDDVAVEHFRYSPTCSAASKALNLCPQSKILLTEMQKKINLLSDELALLSRRCQVESDCCFRLPSHEDTVR